MYRRGTNLPHQNLEVEEVKMVQRTTRIRRHSLGIYTRYELQILDSTRNTTVPGVAI